MQLRLAWKLLLGYVLVVGVSISTFALQANRSSERELRSMMGRTPQAAALAAEQLAAYYQGRGSWEGLDRLYSIPAHMGGMGRGMQAAMGVPAVVDVEGLPLLGGLTGRQDTEGATPIMADGRVVGYVLPSATPADVAERDSVQRINRAIFLAALLSIGAALAGAALLTGSLLRPVRELTSAARALAGGDLARRVEIRTRDELGELSEAFNHMAQSLQQAEALRRDMTADIAHELRNPLSVMQARVEAVMDGIYAPTPASLQPVLEQTQLLNRLVEDLRTLALADAGQLPLERIEVDLSRLLERTVEGYQAQAHAANVDLRLALPIAAQVRVWGDPGRIEQVLGNLLSNAMRHAPAGTSIDVRLDVRGDRAAVEVADQGEGIPSDALPYVFERFYRADRARARADGGAGLGMAISRQIVRAHGGTITAANRPEGGAVFVVELPVLKPEGGLRDAGT